MKVVELNIFPIKGCSGIPLQKMEIGEAGPLHDREWMIVDAEGKFISQRSHPQLAVIKTSLKSGLLEIMIQSKTFELPLQETDDDYESVTVWSSKVKAQTHSNRELAEALNEHLKQPVKLVRFASKSKREAKKSGVGLGATTRFTDRAPILFTNTASLQDLNRKLQNEIPMSRFRANIILSGAPAWSEDAWQKLKLGGMVIDISQGCGRCGVINIDQQTGVAPSKEVLLKLSEFRRKGSNIYFGVMGVHRGHGVIKVGDEALLSN